MSFSPDTSFCARQPGPSSTWGAAAEQGTKDLIAYTWNTIFLPKNAPADIVATLNAAAIEAMKAPNVRDTLSGLGAKIASPEQSSPEYLAKLVKSEIEKWTAPIKASGAVIP